MSSSSARIRASAITALITFAACKDSTSPPQPAAVSQDQAVTLDGTVGAVLATAPTFTVKDQNGNAVGGVSISVAVTAGGGTLTDAPTKSQSGATSVGTWKLGNIAGVNSVTITVAGLTPLTISVNGKAGPPATIAFVSGANQSALAGTPVPVNPVAQVRDIFGNGVPGQPVTFAVQEGDGIVAGNPVATDASGSATSPQWILGRTAIPQALRAFVSPSIGASVTATVASDYDVDLRFFGPVMPPATLALFTAAAAKIKAVVVGDVPNINVSAPVDLANACGVPGLPTTFNEPLDDVIIYASVGPIDGANQVLGFAFPCFVRGSSGSTGRQTAIGIMKFDSDDIENMIARGNLQDVIEHEMLHIVGIGTLWNVYGLLAGAGTSSTRYTGVMGVNGCITLGGSPVCPNIVPVEANGGAGTADSHWRESTFFNELMTGFINTRTSVPSGPLNPLSLLSVQSLIDLGYSVNSKAADDYVIPGQSASRTLGQWNVDQASASGSAWENVMPPRYFISPTGRLSLVPKR